MFDILVQYIIWLSQTAHLALVLLLVLIVAWLIKLLKQPLLIGYLCAWLLIWGIWLIRTGYLEEDGFFQLFSQLGISLLLFLVGLGLNPATIKEHGKTALGVGVMQIGASVILGFTLDRLLGFDRKTSLLIAAALSFSSTIVIVKLLHDKQEADTVYGKITTGVLIVQDIVAMLLLMIVALLGNQAGAGGGQLMLFEGVILLGLVIGVSKRVMPRILPHMAEEHELILLVGVGWALLLGSAFQYVGFSYEIGCLLAGMSFALSPYRRAMMAKLQPLRDFFIVLFFVQLGMQVRPGQALQYRPIVLILTAFVIVVKPLISSMTISRFRYSDKTAFKTGISLGQMSEFSLILMSLGFTYGFIQDEAVVSVVMMVGLLSILLSSYTLLHNQKLFERLKKIFPTQETEDKLVESRLQVDVVVIGYGKFGRRMVRILQKQGMSMAILEQDPKAYKQAVADGLNVIFADATSQEVLRECFWNQLKMVVSTIREFDEDRMIARQVKAIDPDIVFVALTLDMEHALELYDAGVDYVLLPYHISAAHMGMLIEEFEFDVKRFLAHKEANREIIETLIQDK